MLSFLRDSESILSRGKPGASQPQENTEQQGQDFVVTAQPKKVRNSTILLMVLFVVGLLCILFMIKKSTPAAASANQSGVTAEEAQIETAIAKLTGVKSEMFDGLERIIDKFGSMGNVQNIQIKKLAKNPFMLESISKIMSQILGSSYANDNDAGSREEQIRQQARSLQLLSIMSDARGNCCMIDDKILYQGDSIGGFVVRKITNDSVKLESAHDPKLPTKGNNIETETVEIILKLTADSQN